MKTNHRGSRHSPAGTSCATKHVAKAAMMIIVSRYTARCVMSMNAGGATTARRAMTRNISSMPLN